MPPQIVLTEVPALNEETGLVQAVVEAPQRSRSKLKYDEQIGAFRLRKILPLGAAFPYDFGFVPSTRGDDGDPLDVLVLTEEPLFPGCVLAVKLIGVIEAEQVENGKCERNDRLIAAIETPYNPSEVHALDELPESQIDQLEHFFVSYNAAQGREFKPLARSGPDAARRLVEEGMRRYAEAKKRER